MIERDDAENWLRQVHDQALPVLEGSLQALQVDQPQVRIVPVFVVDDRKRPNLLHRRYRGEFTWHVIFPLPSFDELDGGAIVLECSLSPVPQPSETEGTTPQEPVHLWVLFQMPTMAELLSRVATVGMLGLVSSTKEYAPSDLVPVYVVPAEPLLQLLLVLDALRGYQP